MTHEVSYKQRFLNFRNFNSLVYKGKEGWLVSNIVVVYACGMFHFSAVCCEYIRASRVFANFGTVLPVVGSIDRVTDALSLEISK